MKGLSFISVHPWREFIRRAQ